MPTRNVVLSQHQEDFLGDLVSSGTYQNASEVLREGLRMLENKVKRRSIELANIQAGLLTGLDQIEHNQFAVDDGNQAIEQAFNNAVDTVEYKKRN
ncbi:MAG: type II toxin-antitoxin system ParD family antitoxin [Gammaproteobacteria bacterium]|nr:MAG: type II toxin-antitoxin system ParD family antitoxin [Gammaproteobacteria bacterium]